MPAMPVDAHPDRKSAATPYLVAAGVSLVTALAVPAAFAPADAAPVPAGAVVAAILERLIVDGGIVAAWLAAGLGWGSLVPLPFRGPRDGPMRAVLAAALGLGLVGLATLGLGSFGLLNTVTAWLLVAPGVVIALLCFARPQLVRFDRREERGEAPSRSRLDSDAASADSPSAQDDVPGRAARWLWVIAGVAVGVGLAAALVPPGLLWADEPAGYDVTSYHLQLPREWYELGRVAVEPHNVWSASPLLTEMHYLLAMHLRGGTAWQGVYAAQLMHLSFGVLTAVAVAAALLPRGRWVAHAAGVLVACVPWTAMLGAVAYNECALMLYATLGITVATRMVAVRATRGSTSSYADVALASSGATEVRPRPDPLPGGEWTGTTASARSADVRTPPHPNPLPMGEGVLATFAIAGALAGLAAGSKLTAGPMVWVGVPAAVLAADLVGRRWRELVSHALGTVLFVVVAAALFSPWAVRAYRATGNPVFPQASAVFGPGWFDAVQIERFVKAHSPREDQRGLVTFAREAGGGLVVGRRLGALWEQVLTNWRYGFVLVPLGVVGLALGWRDATSRALAALLVVWLAFWLFGTHLQGRFLVPLIPLIALACGSVRAAVWPIAVAALAVVCAGVGVAQLGPQVARAAPAIGLTDPKPLLSLFFDDATVDLLARTDRHVVLVGDAQALFYPVPSGRLHYRTVFDVPQAATAVEGWTKGTPPDAIRVIAGEGELRRLARTYHGIPADLGIARPTPGPFVVGPAR
jgi:hypothetical protein